jgi:hypothetical protein
MLFFQELLVGDVPLQVQPGCPIQSSVDLPRLLLGCRPLLRGDDQFLDLLVPIVRYLKRERAEKRDDLVFDVVGTKCRLVARLAVLDAARVPIIAPAAASAIRPHRTSAGPADKETGKRVDVRSLGLFLTRAMG